MRKQDMYHLGLHKEGFVDGKTNAEDGNVSAMTYGNYVGDPMYGVFVNDKLIYESYNPFEAEAVYNRERSK